MKRILCFGDSNTYGYIPASDHIRYDDKTRWTRLISKRLKKFEIIEEGLNSRTILSDDPRPGREGRSGYQYLLPCLESHDPIDYCIVMLGTNECKIRYEKSAVEIGKMFLEFILTPILTRQFYNAPNPKVIIVCPPRVRGKLAAAAFENKYDEQSEQKSIQLEKIFMEIAEKNNCKFVSALDLPVGGDGVHLTKQGHRVLAERLVAEILGK